MKVLEESSGAVTVSALSLSVAGPDAGVLGTLPARVQLIQLIWTGKLEYSVSYNYLRDQAEQDTVCEPQHKLESGTFMKRIHGCMRKLPQARHCFTRQQEATTEESLQQA